MNWDEVYQRMKVMLDALGLSWKEREKVVVTIEGDNLCFSYDGDTFSFKVNQSNEESEER